MNPIYIVQNFTERHGGRSLRFVGALHEAPVDGQRCPSLRVAQMRLMMIRGNNTEVVPYGSHGRIAHKRNSGTQPCRGAQCAPARWKQINRLVFLTVLRYDFRALLLREESPYFISEVLSMAGFCCPVCGESLKNQEKAYICPNRHSFDKAKSGYVHLLTHADRKSTRLNSSHWS